MMDELKAHLQTLNVYLTEQGLTDERQVLIVIVLAMFAVLVALFRGRRIDQVEREEETLEQTNARLEQKNNALVAQIEGLQRQLRERDGTLDEPGPGVEPFVSEDIATEAPAVTEQPAVEEAEKSVEAGLKKTRSQFFGRLSALFSGKEQLDEDLLQRLEELLVSSDLGVKTVQELMAAIREEGRSGLEPARIRAALRQKIYEIVAQLPQDTEIQASSVAGKPRVILMVGVNGVGKTTTIGKLAEKFASEGRSVLLAACDTFRAAAPEQLALWAERTGVSIERGEEDEKPATVAYRAVHRGLKEGADVILVDTAGRQHTKVNLMNELTSVASIISRELPGAPHETILVLDASTGQNALQQAREFNQAVTLSGVIMTKLDGTPKGGVLVGVKQLLGVPIRYIGIGEKPADLRIFNAQEFVDALFEGDLEELNQTELETQSGEPRRAARRRRREANAS